MTATGSLAGTVGVLWAVVPHDAAPLAAKTTTPVTPSAPTAAPAQPPAQRPSAHPARPRPARRVRAQQAVAPRPVVHHRSTASTTRHATTVVHRTAPAPKPVATTGSS
ncbi:MAG: hypothetical protein WCD35_03270 [Mycobacteriales bacterium]